MLVRTIDAEVPLHLGRVRKRVFDEFAHRADEYIATQCKDGVVDKRFENPITRAGIFYNLIDEQYLSLLREAVNDTKRLFANHDISFRLYDIGACVHSYHRITLLWVVNRVEYVFDFLFDSSTDDPFESFYRISEISSCGELLNGDILNNTRQLFEDNAELPHWFVSGLQQKT